MVDTANLLSKNKLIEIYTKYGFNSVGTECIYIKKRLVMSKKISK